MNQHLSSDRLIGYHRSKEDYIESPTNSLQFAYGDHRYYKFTYQLLNQSDILKQKILKQLIQDFSLCENVNLCLISSDLLSVLLKHIKNTNDTIRLLSIQAIKKICAASEGTKTIISRGCIQQIQQLVNDTNQDIRINAYQALLNFSQFTHGVNCLLDSEKILNHLVDKLIQQKIQIILNKTIQLLKCMMQGQKGIPYALSTNIIARLINLINHKYDIIRYNVCMTLSNISFNQNGKQQIIDKGHIKVICHYLEDPNPRVRESACLLLCSLAQINQGKIQILQYCKFQIIVSLLKDTSPTVLNAVQLISNLAENPIGRDKAKPHLNLLNNLNTIERIYIQNCIDVITWIP